MRRAMIGPAMALAILGVGAAGPGCNSLTGTAPIAGETKADEVALGLALAGGAAANNSFALAIESGVLTDKARATQIKGMLDQYDAVIASARDAKKLGDASGYLAKLLAAQTLLDDINKLIPAKR